MMLQTAASFHSCMGRFYHTQDTRTPERMYGKERKDGKRISRGNIHPGKVKPLPTTLPPRDSLPPGPSRMPKQHAKIELFHSKLEPLKHNVILFLVRNLACKL